MGLNRNYLIFKCVVFAVMVLLFGLSETKGQDKEIVRDTSFTIDVEKDSFLVHEPIWLAIKKINATQKSQFINKVNFRQCLRVRDSKGKRYPPVGWFHSTTISELKPGDSLNVTLDLAKHYGERHGGISVINISLPAEKYKIYGSLNVYGSLKDKEGKIIKTNEIEITISDPKGDEREAFKLLNEGLLLRDQKDRESADAKFKRLAEKFPNSVYAPKALDLAAFCYRYSTSLSEQYKAVSRFEELIEEYPKSRYSIEAVFSIFWIYESNKDKAGALAAMRELIKKYPNTEISKRAEESIKKIEKWEF